MHRLLLPPTIADAPALPLLQILLAAVAIVATVLVIKYWQVIKRFTGEVRTELLKASWPWDPKEHGFKRYKELVDSTMVVVVAMLLLAGYISLCDFCLTTIVGALTHNGTFNR